MQPNEIPALPPHHAPTSLKTLLLIFGVLVVAALGYLVWAQNSDPDATDYLAPSVKQTEPTTAADETKDWKTYENKQFGYSVKYPNGLTVKDEGTMTAFVSDPNESSTVWTIMAYHDPTRANYSQSEYDIYKGHLLTDFKKYLEEAARLHAGWLFNTELTSPQTLTVDKTITTSSGHSGYIATAMSKPTAFFVLNKTINGIHYPLVHFQNFTPSDYGASYADKFELSAKTIDITD